MLLCYEYVEILDPRSIELVTMRVCHPSRRCLAFHLKIVTGRNLQAVAAIFLDNRSDIPSYPRDSPSRPCNLHTMNRCFPKTVNRIYVITNNERRPNKNYKYWCK